MKRYRLTLSSVFFLVEPTGLEGHALRGGHCRLGAGSFTPRHCYKADMIARLVESCMSSQATLHQDKILADIDEERVRRPTPDQLNPVSWYARKSKGSGTPRSQGVSSHIVLWQDQFQTGDLVGTRPSPLSHNSRKGPNLRLRDVK